MPHILRIDTDPNVSQQNHNGWTGSPAGLTGNRIEHIPDTLTGAGGGAAGAAAKAGTSIPSPFARLYLFDTAFRMVKNNLQPAELSMYHVLVSHTLDLLELLFQAGGSDELTYRLWNRGDRLSKLGSATGGNMSGGRHPHQVLAKALDLDFRNELAAVQTITLIYYKGALLGGTSPLTLVCTTPNWEQERQNKFIDPPKSSTGRTLFQNEYVPLHGRDEGFTTYLRRWYEQYNNLLPPGGFKEYLYRVFFDSPIVPPLANGLTLNNFEPIQVRDNGSNSTLQVLPGVPLYRVKEADVLNDIEDNSDFVMQPTVDFYTRETSNGAATGVRKPLALASRMDVSGRYVKNTTWNASTVIMRQRDLGSGFLLSERLLPGVDNVKYPFVTTDDFLEDFLIRMPYRLNGARFFTGTPGDMEFMLPVRKEYFSFFTMADLEKQLTLRIETRGLDRVIIATLTIPIRNNRTVPFQKEYNLGATRNFGAPGDGPDTMLEFKAGFGFFPFYRIKVPDPALQSLNEYTMMLLDASRDEANFHAARSVRFFSFEKIVNNEPLVVPSPEHRTPKSGPTQAASYYYKVPQAFDLVEVQLQRNGIPYRGLLLPKFTNINERGYKPFTFAIDFGTSNTHVAYTDSTMGNADPKTLTISDDKVLSADELQMVTLNKPYDGYEANTPYARYRLAAGYGQLIEFEQFIRREFVPPIVGTSYGSPFTFPLRTTVYEKTGSVDAGDNLFSKINLGFNIDLEIGSTGVNRYVTNLKWLFENQPGDAMNRPRVRAFFETLLLMMRNKVLLNQGNLNDTKVTWLAPTSMQADTEDKLVEEWEKAFRRVFKTTQYFRPTPIPESLAPHFYLVTKGVKSFADAVNVDIGGGTADIMLFMKQQQRYVNTSFRFAGYDIWGGGLNQQGYPSHQKDNGFILNYLQYRRTLSQAPAQEDSILDTFLANNDLSAEDIVSLLFRNNEHYKFTQSIVDGRPALRIVLFLHYSAIVYHLVQLIEAGQMTLPRYLTFTGRGSQYLKMLGSSRRLIEFTKMLFRAYTNLPVPPDFEVILSDNPKETTANGAVLFENASLVEKEKYNSRQTVCYWGNAPLPQQALPAPADAPPAQTGFGAPIGTWGAGAGTYGNAPQPTTPPVQTVNAPYEYRRTKIGEVSNDRAFHDSVLQNIKRFLDLTLTDRDIAYYLSEHKIQTPEQYISFLCGPDVTRSGAVYDSYMLARQGLEQEPNQAVSETYFFLPLKHALYELSKLIAS
jgi:hypothetical protein